MRNRDMPSGKDLMRMYKKMYESHHITKREQGNMYFQDAVIKFFKTLLFT